MKFRYNAPVTLTLAILATACLVVENAFGRPGMTAASTTPTSFQDPLAFIRLFSYILGHRDWAHLTGNLTMLLLLGPIVEEKYGSGTLLICVLGTAFVTAIINMTFSSVGIMGASGIVFMLIVMSSLTNVRRGEIPATFLLVILIFFTSEIVSAFRSDQISQLAHLAGGVCGGFFGFVFAKETPRTL